MGATNHTTNYELPQFVGSDKPAWLGDINPAFGAIDAQMKLNADAASDAASAAAVADGKAVNAADAASTADGKAVTAQTTANGAVADIAALASKLNLTEHETVDASALFDVTGLTVNDYFALSQDASGSIFKFYNEVILQNTTNSTIRIQALTAVPGLSGFYGIKAFTLNQAPAEAYRIANAGLIITKNASTVENIIHNGIAVGTDGGVYAMCRYDNEITIPANKTVTWTYFPSLYFNASFGDE